MEEELARLERQGIIEPVQHSEWASPVVTVLKADGSIRLCGDYKRTLNPYCVVDQYPMPRIEDVTFAQLAGCKKFTKIDLSQAYLQLTLNEESRKFTTVNTSRGFYQFRRMPFGVASASDIFQRTIEFVVRGVPHMVVRADDIVFCPVGPIDNPLLRWKRSVQSFHLATEWSMDCARFGVATWQPWQLQKGQTFFS